MSYKVAGIDIHKKVQMVVVVDGAEPDLPPVKRRFGTMPSDLRQLRDWLRAQEVTHVVMESTAQYWRPLWLELEDHFQLDLAQAFSNRAPRGKKHDFKDAERLARRYIAEELVLSFVPGGEQRLWRDPDEDATDPGSDPAAQPSGKFVRGDADQAVERDY